MNRGRIVIISLALVAALAAAMWGGLLLEVHRPPVDRVGETVRLDVARGEPFVSVMRRLSAAGVVDSPLALRIYAKVRRLETRVQSGTYEFTIGETPARVLERLVAGDILRVSVTIPEGYMQWQIADAFEAAGIDSTAMIDAIHDPAVLRERHIEAPSLEGYLFPDTYLVPWGATAGAAVAQMLARLDAVFTDSLFARAAQMGMTPHEVLTLASIVEAEARVDSERAVIAAVYENRLARGMKLEADPTVAYAMGGYRGRLLYADLEIDSPYNTYLHKGLPPGPICSPGGAAIRATLYPDPDTRALYFVARGDGSHIFSETLEEHLAAVREVRRQRGRR